METFPIKGGEGEGGEGLLPPTHLTFFLSLSTPLSCLMLYINGLKGLH